MQCMTQQEIQDVIQRLRQLNDTVQKMSQSAQSGSDTSAAQLKNIAETKMQQELSEVASTIQTKLIGPLSLATKQLQTYQSLINVPVGIATSDGLGENRSCPTTYAYLKQLATALFAPPIAELSALLSSYSGPMSQLNAELQKASSLTIQTSSGSDQASINAPKVSK